MNIEILNLQKIIKFLQKQNEELTKENEELRKQVEGQEDADTMD